MSNSLLRLPQVVALTGHSKSSIYLKVKTGVFPKPIAIGDRARAWLSSDIDALIQAWINKATQSEIRSLVNQLENCKKYIERIEK
jgi:prophage regulatory protein